MLVGPPLPVVATKSVSDFAKCLLEGKLSWQRTVALAISIREGFNSRNGVLLEPHWRASIMRQCQVELSANPWFRPLPLGALDPVISFL